MPKKPFFKQKPIGEMSRAKTRRVYNQKNLVDQIYDLNPTCQTLLLYTQLVPGRYHIGTKNQAQASGKLFKHGEYLSIEHPQTKQECYNSSTIPLALRKQALSKLEQIPEEQIFTQGLSHRPNWNDRTKRTIPFVFSAEALRLFAYSENSTEKIEVKLYKDSARAKKEGATAIISVPSRRKQTPVYIYRLNHIPAVRSQHNLATALTLKPSQIEIDGKPISQRVPHDIANIKFTYDTDNEGSNPITFYPHDIAAYIAIIRDENKAHNLTPLEMNPFPLFSKSLIENFYKKLENNILIIDPTHKSKNHLRKLHLAEKNLLIARAIRTKEHDQTAFWDPSRDGKLKDYDWSID